MKGFFFTFCLVFIQLFPASWSTPPLDINASDGSVPQVAVDNLGNSVAVWVESSRIKSANLPVGASSWTTPTFVSDTGGDLGAASIPKIGIDAEGNAVAIWLQIDEPSPIAVIFAATLSSGSTVWSSPTKISEPTSGTIRESFTPEIDVSSRSGTTLAVGLWIQRQTAPLTINVARVAVLTDFATNTWSSTAILSEVAVDRSVFEVGKPALAATPGNIRAATIWRRDNDEAGTATVRTSLLTDYNTNTWSSATTLSEDDFATHLDISVVINKHSQAAAIWRRIPGAERIVQAVTLQNYATNTWSSVTDLSSNFTNIFDPRIAINDLGDTIATWREVQTNVFIRWATLENYTTNSWSVVRNLTSPTGQNVVDNQIVKLDKFGNAIDLWIRVTTDKRIVQASTLTAGSTNWSPFQQLSVNGVDAATPDLAVNSSGFAIGVWQRGGVIQSSTKSNLAPLAPVNIFGIQKTNRFPTQSERFNDLTWSASPSSDIVSYAIFRNGLRIATVQSPTLEYQDHNQQKGVTTTYGISSINSIGEISSQKTVTFK